MLAAGAERESLNDLLIRRYNFVTFEEPRTRVLTGFRLDLRNRAALEAVCRGRSHIPTGV